MNLTDRQKELLRAMVKVDVTGCKDSFLFTRTLSGEAFLMYPQPVGSISVDADDSDLYGLAVEGLIGPLVANTQGMLRSKPTQRGIDAEKRNFTDPPPGRGLGDQDMISERKEHLRTSLVGLKATIREAREQDQNCHFSVGEAMNIIRQQIIERLDGHQKELAEKTIAPLQFAIPAKWDELKIWTVLAKEAWRLYGQLEPLVMSESVATKTPRLSRAMTTKVFLVHGHDEASRETIARFLEQLELQPVILHEQANEGKTIIEKFEAYADVSFAVVLLTPDDEGKAAGAKQFNKRARQNVILELGYFLGTLGRANVCALYKGNLEIPSDYLGVLFVPLDASGGWRLLLGKEMKAAGLPIDMNKVF